MEGLAENRTLTFLGISTKEYRLEFFKSLLIVLNQTAIRTLDLSHCRDLPQEELGQIQLAKAFESSQLTTLHADDFASLGVAILERNDSITTIVFHNNFTFGPDRKIVDALQNLNIKKRDMKPTEDFIRATLIAITSFIGARKGGPFSIIEAYLGRTVFPDDKSIPLLSPATYFNWLVPKEYQHFMSAENKSDGTMEIKGDDVSLICPLLTSNVIPRSTFSFLPYHSAISPGEVIPDTKQITLSKPQTKLFQACALSLDLNATNITDLQMIFLGKINTLINRIAPVRKLFFSRDRKSLSFSHEEKLLADLLSLKTKIDKTGPIPFLNLRAKISDLIQEEENRQQKYGYQDSRTEKKLKRFLQNTTADKNALEDHKNFHLMKRYCDYLPDLVEMTRHFKEQKTLDLSSFQTLIDNMRFMPKINHVRKILKEKMDLKIVNFVCDALYFDFAREEAGRYDMILIVAQKNPAEFLKIFENEILFDNAMQQIKLLHKQVSPHVTLSLLADDKDNKPPEKTPLQRVQEKVETLLQESESANSKMSNHLVSVLRKLKKDLKDIADESDAFPEQIKANLCACISNAIDTLTEEKSAAHPSFRTFLENVYDELKPPAPQSTASAKK